MHQRPRHTGEYGAGAAALRPVGVEHEVLHDELPAAVEEVGEALSRAVGRGEAVAFIDGDHGELLALLGEGVAGFGEFLLFGEEGFAGVEPFGGRDDL